MVNAICRTAFLGHLDELGMSEALADLDADFAEGRLQFADVLWRAALNRSAELSRKYTAKLGTRSLDVLHVACAQELKLRNFVTFDVGQQELAAAVGMKLVRF